MIANRYRREGITLWWCPFFAAVVVTHGGAIWTHYQKYRNGTAGTAAVMNGHGSFSGVGAFSVVGHNGIHSNIKILEKLG